MTGFNSKRDAAADKLQEDLINYGTSWSQDGKRIDPMSVYKEPAQEPVAWMCHPFGDDEVEYGPHKECENCTPLYTTPPQRERVVFPTMLRKMWSGGEVQAWLDENVNKEKNT